MTPALCLEMAGGALARRDFLSALQYARRAASASDGPAEIRCEADMLLALSSLELGAVHDALAFAVNALLSATWLRDPGREERATAVLAVVTTTYPELLSEPPKALH